MIRNFRDVRLETGFTGLRGRANPGFGNLSFILNNLVASLYSRFYILFCNYVCKIIWIISLRQTEMLNPNDKFSFFLKKWSAGFSAGPTLMCNSMNEFSLHQSVIVCIMTSDKSVPMTGHF